MQMRADSVRMEWTRKITETGRVWDSAPKGGGGPIQRRCRSRPAIKGLVFGFNGERGREVNYFIAEVAGKGGSATERIGCCHRVG